MKKNKNVPVDLWVVKIDDTVYWNEDTLKEFPEIKRIFSVYMVDDAFLTKMFGKNAFNRLSNMKAKIEAAIKKTKTNA